jgi:hypothetical protein
MPDEPPTDPHPDVATDADRARNWRGTSRAYLLRRLREAGRQDLVDAVEARRISARAAAIGLGWLQETKRPAPDKRRSFARTQVFGGAGPSRLSILEELWLGPNPFSGSVFHSREELAAAWQQYRGEVMALWGSNGRRPAGWYEFEASPDLHHIYAHERSILYERGLLELDEARRLEFEWRREFDQAQTRFRTDAQRRRHYEECDLPDSLRTAWEAERRRRVKPGKADSPVEPPPAAAGDVAQDLG